MGERTCTGSHPLSLPGLRLDTEGALKLLFGRVMKWRRSPHPEGPSMFEHAPAALLWLRCGDGRLPVLRVACSYDGGFPGVDDADGREA